jgi:hypothetical protein
MTTALAPAQDAIAVSRVATWATLGLDPRPDTPYAEEFHAVIVSLGC